jgi:hypothetical protein
MNQSTLVDIDPQSLTLWCPVDAVIAENRPAIEWMDLQGVEFKEPFFEQTLDSVDSERKRDRVVTELDSLLQFDKICDGLSPSGFIFHSSRCGSTLVANACRALTNSLVIAEAPVIDKLLTRFFTDAPAGSTKELLYLVLLRAAVGALGQRFSGKERHYFVKLACTSTLQMQRIRSIWPAVPFVFVYRNPIEIIVSNVESVPEWMRADVNPATAAAIVGVDEEEVTKLSAEEYCARSLGSFFTAVDANFDARINLLNYEQLSCESLVEVVRFFGIEPSDHEVSAIEKVCRLYSKDLTCTELFEDDSTKKRSAASEVVCRVAERWSRSSYDRLNARARVMDELWEEN